MSRFADADATRRVDLGPCECPGTPHASDWIDIRADLSDTEVGILNNLPADYDEAAARIAEVAVAGWNLVDKDGPVEPTGETLNLLKTPTMRQLGEAINDVIRENIGVPKASAGVSRASSRATRSRTPKRTRTPGT